jgi:hypothetical protein
MSVPVFQPLEKGCLLGGIREIGVSVSVAERAEVGTIRGSEAAQPIGLDIGITSEDITEVIAPYHKSDRQEKQGRVADRRGQRVRWGGQSLAEGGDDGMPHRSLVD